MKKCTLLLVLAFALLSSCGNPEAAKNAEPTQGDAALHDAQADPPEGSAEAGADTGAASENEPQETVLTFSLIADTYRGSFRRRIDLFEQAYPGVKVNMVEQPDPNKYFDQTITALMAGMGPDIFMHYPSVFTNLGKSGLLTDFYTLIDSDESFSRDDFYMNVIDAYAEDGALYMFPLNFNYQVVTVNKDMPDAIVSQFYGLETITYLDWVKLYKEADVAGRYRMDAYSRAVARNMIAYEAAGYIDFGKKEANLNNPAFIGALDEIKSVLSRTDMQGRFSSTGLVPHRRSDIAIYFYDTCAFYIPRNMYEAQYVIDMEKDPFGHPIPMVTENGELVINSNWMGQSEVLSIPSNAKNKELAWAFIEFMASDESVAVYDGIGTLYKKTDDDDFVLYALTTLNYFPTNRHLFEIAMKACLEALTYIGGNMRTFYDMDNMFGRESVDDLIANKAAYIQSIYELYDKWNNTPVAPLHADKLSVISDVIADYVDNSAKTAEEAASEMQNIMHLSLNE